MIDPTGRAAGRGAYLCRDATCWAGATRRRAVERALGVTLPESILDLLAAGPEALAAPATDKPAPVPLDHDPDSTLDPTSQGGARGQE